MLCFLRCVESLDSVILMNSRHISVSVSGAWPSFLVIGIFSPVGLAASLGVRSTPAHYLCLEPCSGKAPGQCKSPLHVSIGQMVKVQAAVSPALETVPCLASSQRCRAEPPQTPRARRTVSSPESFKLT